MTATDESARSVALSRTAHTSKHTCARAEVDARLGVAVRTRSELGATAACLWKVQVSSEASISEFSFPAAPLPQANLYKVWISLEVST